MKAFKIQYANKEQKEKHQAAMREMGRLLAKICNENPDSVNAVLQNIGREEQRHKPNPGGYDHEKIKRKRNTKNGK